MKRIVISAVILLGINNFTHASAEENVVVIRIWPKSTLSENAGLETESNMPSRGDDVIRITDITDPSITVFKSKQSQEKTPAVIICPGGGYSYLAFNKEGTKIAEWFNSLGITGIVLKYRAPNQRDNAFKDIQRAIRIVRDNAEGWNIDSKQIGVIGFSAGAHLCTRASGEYATNSYEPVDDKDTLSCKPDFAILMYPAYLYDGRNGLREDVKVSSQNPRTFIVQTQDDSIGVENSIYYYNALKNVGIQTELHIFPTGGHGYGMEPGENHTVSQWPKLCEKWLKQIGIIEKIPTL
ncbi:MAG: alpha/beta hydrolase [Sedimentisphaerales bacterium]|nr:alpha/beta hydrolase [Sedimentisphaerales bacterium]